MFCEEIRLTAPTILTTGTVPGPPTPPFRRGRAYPLAADVERDFAAVSFAALDPYDDLQTGWWCFVRLFALHDGRWREVGEHDNTTTQRPFARPDQAENSTEAWVDWLSHDYSQADAAEEPVRHSFFGIAPKGTARLTVSVESGRERAVRITPWNGAFVVFVDGGPSTLIGYASDGRVLGSIVTPADPDPGPASGVALEMRWLDEHMSGLAEPEVGRGDGCSSE